MTKDKPAWTCPKGCSQQPCPHSAEAGETVLPNSPWRYEQLEDEGDEDDG